MLNIKWNSIKRYFYIPIDFLQAEVLIVYLKLEEIMMYHHCILYPNI